ncbi:MAG: hypothetical protein Q7R97_00020 [Candidatus Daviesbacteria bacterium]|nr:hypothetical protein [Candidatus Daviesbacteria bacterium]
MKIKLLLVISLNLILLSFVFRTIYPLHFSPQPLFFSDLIGKPLFLPLWLIFLSGVGNIILLFLISQKLFLKKYVLILPLIYNLSFWPDYLIAGGSNYPFLLFFLLLFGLGYLFFTEQAKKGLILMLVGFFVLIYSSFLMLITLLLLIAGLNFSPAVAGSKNISKSFVFLLFLLMPLLLLILINLSAFQNIFQRDIKFFSDPGLINNTNVFQGEGRDAGLFGLVKISENKYLNLSKEAVNKSIKNILPSTYFTPQEKLLNFSFTPPIMVGFLIPAFLGLYLVLKNGKQRKYLLLSLILLMPSFLSKNSLDLNRLLIFFPVILLLISLGLINLYENKRKILLGIIIFLVLFQLVGTLFDLGSREYPRFERYFIFTNFEIS